MGLSRCAATDVPTYIWCESSSAAKAGSSDYDKASEETLPRFVLSQLKFVDAWM